MCILSKIWSFVKIIFAALAKEPANNVLDTDIPVDEQSTESTESTEEQPNTDNSVSNSNESTDTNVESK